MKLLFYGYKFHNCIKAEAPYVQARPFKISAEEDAADTEYIGFTDVFKDNACLVRVATKRFTENGPTKGLPVVYVYLKKFKYEREHQNYMKQAQVSYTLHQFKALQENMEQIDALIDNAFTRGSNDSDAELQSPAPKKQKTEGVYGNKLY